MPLSWFRGLLHFHGTQKVQYTTRYHATVRSCAEVSCTTTLMQPRRTGYCFARPRSVGAAGVCSAGDPPTLTNCKQRDRPPAGAASPGDFPSVTSGDAGDGGVDRQESICRNAMACRRELSRRHAIYDGTLLQGSHHFRYLGASRWSSRKERPSSRWFRRE